MNILFAPCYLGDHFRMTRYLKWLDYHRKLKLAMGIDKIIFIDNASNIEDLKRLKPSVILDDNLNLLFQDWETTQDLTIVRCDTFLDRTSVHEYPYCWRALDYMKKLIPILGVRKMVILDTDGYVLTSRLAHFIRDKQTGWTSFWCKKYGFPESSINILCKDSMDLFLKFPIPTYNFYDGEPMENLLPFTEVLKTEFDCDRYGEDATPQTPEMDYLGQHNGNCADMIFDMEKTDGTT